MTNTVNSQYQKALNDILRFGKEITTRNSDVLRVRNQMMTFHQTPLVSVRKTAWKSALREMEWFLSGSINTHDLHPSVHKWWAPWEDKYHDIPNNYSQQFRYFAGQNTDVDQIEYLKDSLKNHPNSRRAVITTWNTADMVHPETPITNCHGTVIQCFVDPDDSVHMTMYQRSSDMVLGLPHNLIQYWALLTWLSHTSNRKVGSFTWIGGDCHIYKEHFPIARKIISIQKDLPIPVLTYKPTSEEFKADDFSLDIEYKYEINDPVKMIV